MGIYEKNCAILAWAAQDRSPTEDYLKAHLLAVVRNLLLPKVED